MMLTATLLNSLEIEYGKRNRLEFDWPLDRLMFDLMGTPCLTSIINNIEHIQDMSLAQTSAETLQLLQR